MGEPPVLLGALHETTTEAFAALAPTLVGLEGTWVSVSALVFDDDGELPILFVAMTLKTYGVPILRPLMVHDRVLEVQVPPGDPVTL